MRQDSGLLEGECLTDPERHSFTGDTNLDGASVLANSLRRVEDAAQKSTHDTVAAFQNYI